MVSVSGLKLRPPEDSIPATQVTQEVLLYRGFSNPAEYRSIMESGIAPRLPLRGLRTTFDLFTLDSVTLAHVIGTNRDRLKSFSFQWNTAVYYATHTPDDKLVYGWVAVVPLPGLVDAIYAGSDNPEIYTCEDGSIWLDPRHTIVRTDLLRNRFDDWLEMKYRAQVDDEFLLSCGRVYPNPDDIYPVTPDDCDPSFLPWTKWWKQVRPIYPCRQMLIIEP